MEDKKIKLGLFGFGCVGQGLYDVLNHSEVLEASVEKICVKDRTKERKIDSSYFTFDKAEILNRSNLDVVVELIDDADEAFKIVSAAMQNSVNVVTANKKMLAEHFSELYELQKNMALRFCMKDLLVGRYRLFETWKSTMTMSYSTTLKAS